MLLHEAIVGLITTEHNDTCSALPCSKTFYWCTDKKFRKKTEAYSIKLHFVVLTI